MVVLGVFSIAQMKKINGSTVDIAANWLPSVKVLGEMQYTASTIRRSELGSILETDKTRLPLDEAAYNDAVELLTQMQKLYVPMISDPKSRGSTTTSSPSGRGPAMPGKRFWSCPAEVSTNRGA